MAQVYGVGRESRIVSLDILEEEDVVYPLGDGSEEGVGGGRTDGCEGGDCWSVGDDKDVAGSWGLGEG